MKFTRIYSKILLILFVSVIFLGFKTIEVKALNSQENDFKKQVVPLKTVEAGNGFQDLQSLKITLKDKKIVAIGEATHGTKEFFQMKHRMLEFLVEEMGYRLFAIEASFGECQIVNDYVLYGKGNSKDAVKAMGFWTWSTEEVEKMVQWIRIYNENPQHKSKIKFYGFDMQSTYTNKERIIDYLKTVDNESVNKYEETFRSFNDSNIRALDKNGLTNIKMNIQNLITIFENNKDNYISKSSSSQYELIHKHLNIIHQNLQLDIIQCNDFSWIEGSNYRDYCMAENVKWILDYEKQFGNNKIMLWAHNGHVCKDIPNYISMGANLKKIYNDDMYSIAQEFYGGSFRAYPYETKANSQRKLEQFTIKDSPFYTFGYGLKTIYEPLYFMDFKYASKDKRLAQWLSEPKLIHEIGAAYSENSQQLCLQVPVNAFDGIIFISNTSPSVGLK